MVKAKTPQPTELELLMLKALWENSPQTARQIRDALAAKGRKLAHTSVITTLQKMVVKKQLKQLDPAEGKAYRFAPRITEEKVSENMLGDLVDRVFNGSPEAVMLSLMDTSELGAESLKRLRKAFNEKLKGKNQ